MRYGAALIVEAERPGSFGLGRFGIGTPRAREHARRWRRGRWTLEVGRVGWRVWAELLVTYEARPVSTPTMLRVQAATGGGDLVAQLVAIAGLLRAAFPRAPWWRRWLVGDPARAILALPADAQRQILDALFRIPGTGASAVEEDPYAAIRAAQRAASRPTTSKLAPTLATALAYVEAHYGAGWYFNPARWGTADGYAPFTAVWVAHAALETVAARRQLEGFAVQGYTAAKDPRREHERTLRAAFPGEPGSRN
jgi:hypothetical protein